MKELIKCNYCGEPFPSIQGRKSCCPAHRALYKKEREKIYRSKPDNIEKAHQRYLRNYIKNFVPATRGRKPKDAKKLFEETAYLAKDVLWLHQLQDLPAEKWFKLDFKKITFITTRQ